ncbi:hypothetical protein [Roseovarius aestuarii]|uniref:Uncharacterized protein n=1 Tax=Roseovarius aestuarii TaxID=475083 RepID=A0A1X7BNL6_9RHOB|nr:hypothetical protein [Roseovarius aestuarii]SMC11215.1 hypothetical protein ROA7745_01026 [Roseovarius aestuarii]
MNVKDFLTALARSFDPKRDLAEISPRPLLLAKIGVEYVFRLAGFFIVLCLITGMTLAACPSNQVLANLPFILGFLFCFYIAVTTLGLPVFAMITEIENVIARRILGYTTIFVMLAATLYTFAESPIFSLLLSYVGRLFPEAMTCSSGLLQLDPTGI